jgi:hypothetical protein
MMTTKNGFWYVENGYGGVEGAERTALDAIVRAQDLADASGRVFTVYLGGGSLDHEVSVLPSAGKF